MKTLKGTGTENLTEPRFTGSKATMDPQNIYLNLN